MKKSVKFFITLLVIFVIGNALVSMTGTFIRNARQGKFDADAIEMAGIQSVKASLAIDSDVEIDIAETKEGITNLANGVKNVAVQSKERAGKLIDVDKILLIDIEE